MMTMFVDSEDRTPERRRRFERIVSPAIRITSDDLTIFRHLGRFRFLRSIHIVRLLPDRSPRKLIERLCDLYHAGYLDRPRAQLEYFSRSGSAPLIYALGNKGARIVADLNHVTPPTSDWTDKNREAKRPYIEHTLLLADFMVGLERALRERNDIHLIDARSLLADLPADTRLAKSPWTLTGELRHGTTRHLIPATPDAVFALDFKTADRRSYFFVEADRATMPIHRTDLSQSSYRRRLLAYLAAHRAKQPSERFGMDNLRVLTVTTSAERVASMIAAVKDITNGRGSNMFLFADATSFVAHANALTLPWATTGAPARLDQPPQSQARQA